MRKTSSLQDLLLARVREIITVQAANGSFKGGHNGPHGDPETPVRNTAHWLTAMCYSLRRNMDSGIAAAAHRATDYLLSDEARPMGASFFCRFNPEKDFCNGLMGQAWAIEGLIAAGEYLDRQDATITAIQVFERHPFIEDASIWRRVSVDGSLLSPDSTFNHQLWFAAIGGLLPDDGAKEKSRKFLDKVASKVQTYSNGVIRHNSRLGTPAKSQLRRPSVQMRFVKETAIRAATRFRMYPKSVGYHSFNLYAFALLKVTFPQHSFWRSERFARIVAATRQASFMKSLRGNPYGYPYNPPGFECAFAGEVFQLGAEYCHEWIMRQIQVTYEPRTGELTTRGVPDRLTSDARIYEACRLNGSYRIGVC